MTVNNSSTWIITYNYTCTCIVISNIHAFCNVTDKLNTFYNFEQLHEFQFTYETLTRTLRAHPIDTELSKRCILYFFFYCNGDKCHCDSFSN